jgi:hypothetical protein
MGRRHMDIDMARASEVLTEAQEALEAISGIEVNDAHKNREGRLLVKVMDEAAIGQYFATVRKFDNVYDDDVTRNCLEDCVLDAWVKAE